MAGSRPTAAGGASTSGESGPHHAAAEPLHAFSMDEDSFSDEQRVSSSSSDDDDNNAPLPPFPRSRRPPPPLGSTNIPSLVAAIMAAGTTGGTTYAFGLYASALKHTLRLSQSELDTISSAFFCAGLLSWAPGLAVDRFGPRAGTAAGGVLGALSLLSYWAVATSAVPVPRSAVVPVLSVLGIACFVSSALVTGSVFKVIVSSTGTGTKGTAVGAAKGYVGLGSGAYACIFEAIRSPPSGRGGAGTSGEGGGGGGGDASDLNFLPMAAFFAVAVGTIPALCLLPPKAGVGTKRDAASPLHFRAVYAGLLGLGAVVVGTSIRSLYDEASSEESHDRHHNATFEIDGDVDEFDAVDRGTEIDAAASDDGSGGGGGQNYGMAVLIVVMWFGPIVSMLCIPRAHDSIEVESSSLGEQARARRGGSMGRKLPQGGEEQQQQEQEEGADHDLLQHSHGRAKGLDKADWDYDGDSSGGNSVDEMSDAEAGGGDGRSAARRGPEDDREQLLPGDSPTTPSSSLPSSKRQIENLTLTQMLRTVPSWLLLWTCTILAGGGTVITNNVGQMVEALRLDPTTASASLALFSAAQAASRVMTGAVSESALRWSWHVPRPAFLVLASFAGCMSHLVLAAATTEVAFVVGVALSGAAFGMIWPLMVLIVGECFGTAHVGANYMFYDGVTSAIGTLILSKFVAQEVYESHITKHSDEDGLTCYGEGCFELSHFIIAGLSVSCVISSVALMYKTRAVYEKD